MSRLNRRTFVLRVVAGTTALITADVARSQEGERVTETDPYARTFGFRLDTTKVDQVKFPRHTEAQKCSECQLFSGKAGDAVGPCSFYGGRLVPPNGWCRNFKVKKAG